MGESCLGVRPYFSSSAQHVFLVFLRWFLKWEVNGLTATFLFGSAFEICLKQQATSSSNSYLAFTPCIL